MVLAGRPVASDRRLAARPVGEAKEQALRADSRTAIGARRAGVLRVPGPPVSTLTGWLSAVRMADCCSGESSVSKPTKAGGKSLQRQGQAYSKTCRRSAT